MKERSLRSVYRSGQSAPIIAAVIDLPKKAPDSKQLMQALDEPDECLGDG